MALQIEILHEWSFVWYKNPPLVFDSKGKAVWKGLAYYDADYDGGRALKHAGPLHKTVAAAQCRRESRRRSVRARDVTPERQPASAQARRQQQRLKDVSKSTHQQIPTLYYYSYPKGLFFMKSWIIETIWRFKSVKKTRKVSHFNKWNYTFSTASQTPSEKPKT
jgi:hypothetical protein